MRLKKQSIFLINYVLYIVFEHGLLWLRTHTHTHARARVHGVIANHVSSSTIRLVGTGFTSPCLSALHSRLSHWRLSRRNLTVLDSPDSGGVYGLHVCTISGNKASIVTIMSVKDGFSSFSYFIFNDALNTFY